MFRMLPKVCLRRFNSNFVRVIATKNVKCTFKTPNKSYLSTQCTRICHDEKVPLSIMLGGIMTFMGLSKDEEEEKEPELITIIKRSMLLIQKEEFQRAEELLHIALKMAQDQRNSDGITYIFDVMANLAYDIGDFSKAHKLFVKVMQRLMADGVQANDNRMIHMSLKLAKIYQHAGDNRKAEDGYKFCLENLEHKVNKEDDHSEDTLLLWAMTLDFYAHFLLEANRLKEAYDCFEKAYNTCVQVSGKANEQVVILLNDLGTVSNLLGHTDKAISFFEEAVEIGSHLPEMQDLASVYINLGQIYLIKNMLSDCEKACAAGKKSAVKYGDKETEGEADDCLKQVKQAMRG